MRRAARLRVATRAELLAALAGLSCTGAGSAPPAPAAAAPVAASVVEGFVSDLDRQPIEGAQVFVADEGAGTLTNERGAYRIDVPTPGVYQIKAARDGFTRDSVTVTVAVPSHVRADFVLDEAPPCQGPCLDRLGNPIACC